MRKLALVLACALSSGCSSTVATIMHPEPYAGTRLSASFLVNSDATSSFFVSLPFVLLDFPFTLVLDTVLLPVTAIIAAGEAEEGAK